MSVRSQVKGTGSRTRGIDSNPVIGVVGGCGGGAIMRAAIRFLLGLATVCLLEVHAAAQPSTGALIGTLKDPQGGVLSAAVVQVSSPSLIGGTLVTTTNARGQLRFPALPP